MVENKKVKAAFFIFSLACFAAIFACFIVNFAIWGKLTWFFIPLVSVIFVWPITSVALLSKKHKIRNSIAVFTVAILPYLFFLDFAIGQISDADSWFLKLGIPCAVIIAVSAWISYFIFFKLKIDLFYRISLLTLLLGVIAAPLIKYFAMRYAALPFDWTDIIDVAASFLAAGVLFVVGYLRKINNR